MAKKKDRKPRLIYDFNESDLDRRVYLEKENGERNYYPFYSIKVENGIGNLSMVRWPSAKKRREHLNELSHRKPVTAPA